MEAEGIPPAVVNPNSLQETEGTGDQPHRHPTQDQVVTDAGGREAGWNVGAAFSDIIDRAPFGVYIVDSQFRIHSVNAGAQVAFANVRPLIGRDFGEAMRILWPESFASEAVARFRHTLTTGESYVAPTLNEAREDVGAEQSYEWELHRVKLPDEQFGVACYFYDSTKLRRAEAALREARRKVDAALLAGEVGTYYWDIGADRLMGDVNFALMFGIVLDQEGGAPLSAYMQVVHPDDHAAVQEQIQRTLATDIPYRAEYRILHPTGERWVIARGVVERNRNREPVGWAGVVVDISDRKRAEDERRSLLESERAARSDAERASRIKDEFLATLSHELRTPLSAILGWSEVLKLQHRNDTDLAQGLQTIERNARAQTRIIEDLLDMSRIISGKVRLDVQQISLAQVVQAAVDTIRPAAGAKGVVLDTLLDPLPSVIRGDANRLQQVFWNLLSNAVKFTPRDGRVQVVMARVDSHFEVNVIDTGDGINPDFLPLVFDRFRQADASTTRHHGGLGLGLAIVRQLVELHGGNVLARSAGPGKGATFTVALPVAAMLPEIDVPEEEPNSLAPEATIRSASGEVIAGLKVLLVDDEPDSRDVIKRILEMTRATVVTAASAREAIELMRRDRPDVLISDIGMPQEDGYSLIRRVRALPPESGGRTPAIALTAYARAEDRERAMNAGFQYHMAKPVDPVKLVAVVVWAARRP